MSVIKFKGKTVRKKIGTGFWGIENSETGDKWLPVNLPEDLQLEGINVVIEGEEIPDFVSVFMWGSGLRILRYEILA